MNVELSNLVDALVKFQEWEREYLDIKFMLLDTDSAAELMSLLGIRCDDVNVLIGGSNAPIFRRAANEIRSLREMLDANRCEVSKLYEELKKTRN